MRPVAVVFALLALGLSLIALAGCPDEAQPAEKSAAAPPAKATQLVADKTRIDPVTVDPAKAEEKIERLPGLTPDQAKKTIAVQNGFQMQLVASEPNVADPVDGAFDEAG